MTTTLNSLQLGLRMKPGSLMPLFPWPRIYIQVLLVACRLRPVLELVMHWKRVLSSRRSRRCMLPSNVTRGHLDTSAQAPRSMFCEICCLVHAKRLPMIVLLDIGSGRSLM